MQTAGNQCYRFVHYCVRCIYLTDMHFTQSLLEREHKDMAWDHQVNQFT